MYKTFLWPKFKPFTKEINSGLCTCGGSAASIITGISNKEIHELHPDNGDWSETWMKNFFVQNGFKIKKIKKNFYDDRRKFSKVIHSEHVVLALLCIHRTENSWAVINGNKIYHLKNMFSGIEGMEILLNFPPMSLFLVAPKEKNQRI